MMATNLTIYRSYRNHYQTNKTSSTLAINTREVELYRSSNQFPHGLLYIAPHVKDSFVFQHVVLIMRAGIIPRHSIPRYLGTKPHVKYAQGADAGWLTELT
jgi:uncharacterized membrane protein SirB2